MTIAVTKTRAEQGLLELFEKQHDELPGTGWVAALRRQAIGTFAAKGLPHRRIEEWKYTDLRERMREAPRAQMRATGSDAAVLEAALGPVAGVDAFRLVLVDGRFDAALSAPNLGEGVEWFALGGMLAKAPDWLNGKFTAERTGSDDAVAALNLAFMSDGVMLKAKAGAVVAKPILLVNMRTGGGAIATRNIVSVEKGASLTLIEAHVQTGEVAGYANIATDIDIADGGGLAHIQVVCGKSGTTHLAHWRTRIGAAATYRAFQLTAGAGLARNELTIGFTGADAKLDISGAFLGRGSDHIDTTLVVDHSTTGCESRELFKGVLDDRARGIFQGKIVVQAEAQKTDGKQMAQALMLSEDAEFDSKPELEIYADDVVCGHGSTAAELDTDMIFYLMSRGIPRAEARAMLIESFVGEAIDKIENEALREALMAIAVGWLRNAPSSNK